MRVAQKSKDRDCAPRGPRALGALVIIRVPRSAFWWWPPVALSSTPVILSNTPVVLSSTPVVLSCTPVIFPSQAM